MNRRGGLGVAVVVAGWGMALSSSALAQPVPAGAGAESAESEQVEQTKQLYKEGVREAALGNWEKARALFLEAFRRKRHFQIALNLGQAEFRAGRHLEAAEHLAFFMREAQGVGDEERQKARDMLDEAKKKIGTLVIGTDRAGAEIFVDGASMGATPLGRLVFVAPGKRVIEARVEGAPPVREERVVEAGAALLIDLRPGESGGAEAGKAAAATAAAGGANKAVVLAGSVASGVAVAMGIGFSIGASSKLAERGVRQAVCATQAECDRYNAAELPRATFAAAALASFLVSGVLGAGTLTYALVNTPGKPASTAQAGVFLGPETAGGMITVTW